LPRTQPFKLKERRWLGLLLLLIPAAWSKQDSIPVLVEALILG